MEVLVRTRAYDFERKLSSEQKKSRYTFGFPNGNGECNCATCLERLAFARVPATRALYTRRGGFR
jgi:hypothetical protein